MAYKLKRGEKFGECVVCGTQVILDAWHKPEHHGWCETCVDDVRLKTDIVAVVSEVMPLTLLDQPQWKYRGLCPFHEEQTPSFHVDANRGFFHCFGCSIGGDMFDFVGRHQRIPFREVLRSLGRRVGIEERGAVLAEKA